MIGGVGSVLGLTVMIATEGFFVWCCSALKRVQELSTITMPLHGVSTVDAPLQER
jgi:hypothetical protein